MTWGRSRRGASTGSVVLTTLIMIAAAAISGELIYHNLGASTSIDEDSSSGVGQLGALSNSTLANSTAAVAGQLAVQVTDAALPADGFLANSTTSTFTCAGSPSAAYLTLTNNGTGSATIAYVSIASGGFVTEFTPSGGCDIGGLGSGATTVDVIFPADSQIGATPVSGQNYTGAVDLSNGVSIQFEGVWR